MARLEERDYVYFTTVRSFCGTCREAVPARIFFRSGKVWQQSLCPRCVSVPVMIAADKEWYLRETQKVFPSDAPLPGAPTPQKGCPSDCGPCSWHAAKCKSVQATACSREAARNAAELLSTVPVERLYVECQGMESVIALRELMSAKVKQVVLRSPDVKSLDRLRMEVSVVLSPGDAETIARLTGAGVRIELEALPDEAGVALELLRGNGEIIALTVTAKGVAVDAAVRTVCEQSCGELSPADFRPGDSPHPLCWLSAQFGQPPRTIAVHAVMDPGAFDCFRAMLCPHWALVHPGVMAPACTVGFIYGEN